MKNVITSFAFLLVSYCAHSQSSIDTAYAETGTITVTLRGLDSDEGQLMVALYASDATWLSDSLMGIITEINEGEATVVFKEVPYGIYAISSFHDQNSNDELDAGLFGIPKEPYACSKGAKGRFGPPKWEDAKFEVSSANSTQEVMF